MPNYIKLPSTRSKNSHWFPLPILFALVSLFFTTACSSMCHRQDALAKVVDAQSELLKNLNRERADKEVVKRLQKDPLLLEAERHLREAIEALSESNEAVKKAL